MLTISLRGPKTPALKRLSKLWSVILALAPCLLTSCTVVYPPPWCNFEGAPPHKFEADAYDIAVSVWNDLDYPQLTNGHIARMVFVYGVNHAPHCNGVDACHNHCLGWTEIRYDPHYRHLMHEFGHSLSRQAGWGNDHRHENPKVWEVWEPLATHALVCEIDPDIVPPEFPQSTTRTCD